MAAATVPTEARDWLEAGLAQHRRGNLASARHAYEQALQKDPRSANGWHLLGLLHRQAGDPTAALTAFDRAVALAPRRVDMVVSRARALMGLGRTEDAVAGLRRALALDPGQAAVWAELGQVLADADRWADSRTALERALALGGAASAVSGLLGLVCERLGDPVAAMAHYEAATADGDTVPPLLRLAKLRQERGEPIAAADCLARAALCAPDRLDIRRHLGAARSALGDAVAAEACFRSVLARDPGCAEDWTNLGVVLAAQARWTDAAEAFTAALHRVPAHASAAFGLGNALRQSGDLPAAAAAFDRALSLTPRDARCWSALGVTRLEQGDEAAAIDCFDRALALDAEMAEAVWGRAQARLRQGDLVAGWRDYAHRWRVEALGWVRRPWPQPPWPGPAAGPGGVVVWGEQGIGDELLFASLMPELVVRGIPLALECDPRLHGLLQRSLPGVAVVGRRDPPAPLLTDQTQTGAARFCWQCPAADLAAHLRADLAAFGSGGGAYLVPDAQRVAGFRQQFPTGRRLVGVSWFTRNPKAGLARSVSLSALAGALDDPRLCLVSLQYGDTAAERSAVRHAGGPDLFSPPDLDPWQDLDGLAAAMAALDAVVSIDNATVHLAGGLGIPTWVLLPRVAEWRWLTGRTDCVWWPSVRLVRQASAGDWTSVLSCVRRQLVAHLFPVAAAEAV